MRIKNTVSNTHQNIIAYVATILVCGAIDIGIFFMAINAGMTPVEIVQRMFLGVDLATKLMFLFTFIMPFVSLIAMICQIRHAYVVENKTPNFVKYIDFLDDKMMLYYPKIKEGRSIYYNDVDSLELIFDTCFTSFKGLLHPTIKDIWINIEAGSYSCSIHRALIKLNTLLKIAYYSQYMKNFSYKFIGTAKEEVKASIGSVIDEYIQNNYKKTLYRRLFNYETMIIWILIFSLIIVLLVTVFTSLI